MLENTPENRQPYEVMLTEGERGYLRVASWPWLPDMDEFNENLPRFQEAFNTEDTPPEHLEALRALMAGDKDTWRIKNHMNKFMNRFMNLFIWFLIRQVSLSPAINARSASKCSGGVSSVLKASWNLGRFSLNSSISGSQGHEATRRYPRSPSVSMTS